MFMDPTMMASAAAAAPVDTRPATPVPGLVLHVDGDYLAYYASGNAETSQGEARTNCLEHIEAFRSCVGASKIVVHMTANGCHKGERYLVATVKPYQEQRKGSDKPKNQPYLQSFLMGYMGDRFTVKTWATREADDGIGACAMYAIGRKPGYVAIATADKDLRMLPGLHIDWRNRGLTTVPPGCYDVVGANGKQYGLKWFWLQMLEGDAADNIPGLEYAFLPTKTQGTTLQKVGPKKALGILDGINNNSDAYRMVIGHYIEGYNATREGAFDRFVEQAALLWMRTDPHGTVTDFATHNGHSRINHHFCNEVMEAVERLRKRVESARNTINSFGC